MIKVSVIVPVYNVERCLAQCLDTLCIQSFENIEIICVNDGSTDRSLDILEHYKKFDDRIKIVNKENGGLSSARNVGIDVAQGKWILFVDSDDLVSSVAIEKLYRHAEKYDVDMVVYDYLWNQQLKRRIIPMSCNDYMSAQNQEVFNIETMEDEAYRVLPVSAWSKFYRRDFIKDIKFVDGLVFEDVVYWGMVWTQAKKVAYLPVPLYSYTMSRGDSLMNQRNRTVFHVIRAYRILIDYLKQTPYWESKCKRSAELRLIMDFLFKLDIVDDSMRAEFYDAIKAENYNIDCNHYLLSEKYSNLEKSYVQRFKALQSVTLEEFDKLFPKLEHTW